MRDIAPQPDRRPNHRILTPGLWELVPELSYFLPLVNEKANGETPTLATIITGKRDGDGELPDDPARVFALTDLRGATRRIMDDGATAIFYKRSSLRSNYGGCA